MLIRNWRFLIGVGVSLILLLVLLYQVDLSEVGEALTSANYLYLAPSIALYFVAVYFRAVRWRYLLSPLKVLRVGRLYTVVVIGYMANNLLPARLGELVRAYYLARREPINASSALGTVAVERVYDGMTLLAWAGVAGPGWREEGGGKEEGRRRRRAARKEKRMTSQGVGGKNRQHLRVNL